jgi:serine/threonine protein kinase
MSSDSTEINAFIERIPLFEKNEYEWKLFNGSNKNKNVRLVYMGEIKNNQNNIENDYEKTLFVKEFVIKNNKIELLLKEVFFNYSLQSQKFFPKDIKILLSIDNNYLFLVFKGDNISLSKLIKSGIIDYRTVGSLTKWIIYQITFALYILHENKIIHHDIKPENILISQEGNISIIDFGSAFFKGGKSDSYTLYYSSPDYLINNDSNSDDEKYDMWSLGVVILELYLKQVAIFRKKEIESNNEVEMNELQKKRRKNKISFFKIWS